MSGTEKFRAQAQARAAVEQRESKTPTAETAQERNGVLQRYLGAAYYTARRATTSRRQEGEQR